LFGCECRTVDQCGWKGLKNGTLLKIAESGFDVFLTSDQSIRYQQNLTGFDISILELSTNDFRRLRASAPLVLESLLAIPVGVLVRLEVP